MTETSGQKIKRLRQKKGVTIVKMADDLNISIPALYAYENGSRVPRDEVKKRMAEYLGRTVSFIFY